MLFRLVFKMMIVPAVLIGGFGYYMYATTGKVPFMSSFNKGPSTTQELREKITNKASISSSGKQTFYKWKDEFGQWHFGEKAPDGVKSISINYNPDENVISSVKIKAKETIKKGFSMPSSDAPSGADAYNPAQIQKTLQDAKNIQNLINQRYKEQQEALQNIK